MIAAVEVFSTILVLYVLITQFVVPTDPEPMVAAPAETEPESKKPGKQLLISEELARTVAGPQALADKLVAHKRKQQSA